MKHLDGIDSIVDQFYGGFKKVFYRTTPKEAEVACRFAGLVPQFHVSADGLAHAYPDKLGSLSEEQYEKFCAWHLEICEDLTVLGSSVHGLIVCEKPCEGIKVK
ncbi:hypothetical protein [Paraeggerthella hongkongensis]|uniref:Uncharacterized protein n=1 Tax=Paraeggerthella hongkongensis TaxID=230658 RepID=A0A3N0BE64_9ACTN|nr:hypothetical protein [Paraeggerthella hongkongensis]RNL45998.1 hypothetical protein DMP08_04610 [Paraeggerthella hongkongensis]